MSINKGRMNTLKSAYLILLKNSLIYSLSLLMKRIEEKIQSPNDRVVIVDAEELKNIKNFVNKLHNYGFLYILDDKIISSYCLDVLNV